MKKGNLNGLYYLNNTGHRWTMYENGSFVKVRIFNKDGSSFIRSAIMFEAFGNFASVQVHYQGKRRWFINYQLIQQDDEKINPIKKTT